MQQVLVHAYMELFDCIYLTMLHKLKINVYVSLTYYSGQLFLGDITHYCAIIVYYSTLICYYVVL